MSCSSSDWCYLVPHSVFLYLTDCVSVCGLFRQEAGIPVDIVGGVSIGAFMGALYCKEKDLVICTQKARSWSMVRRIAGWTGGTDC